MRCRVALISQNDDDGRVLIAVLCFLGLGHERANTKRNVTGQVASQP